MVDEVVWCGVYEVCSAAGGAVVEVVAVNVGSDGFGIGISFVVMLEVLLDGFGGGIVGVGWVPVAEGALAVGRGVKSGDGRASSCRQWRGGWRGLAGCGGLV